jgi:hypothetical protein
MISAKEPEVSRDTTSGSRNRKWMGGIALIFIGTLLLFATLTDFGLLGEWLLPVLGVLFLAWGIMASRPGPIIPGGILTGLGVGVILAREVFHFSGLDAGGVITLSLGIGFLLILPLCALFTPRWHWWPTIPGCVLVVVGIALLIGNDALQVVTVLGKIWPASLILAGVILLWQFLRRKERPKRKRHPEP